MPDETVQPAAETSSAPVGVPVETGEVARVDSMIDDFLGDPGVVVDEPARQPERRQEQRSGDEPVPHENPEAQQPEPRNEPAAQRPQNDVVQRLLDQNAELMRMLAERTGKPQEPAAPKSPSADEQRDAVIKQLQDDMGLSAEDAAKHYSIIEKVAEMKAAPALEAARAQQQTREEAERRETDRLQGGRSVRLADQRTAAGPSGVHSDVPGFVGGAEVARRATRCQGPDRSRVPRGRGRRHGHEPRPAGTLALSRGCKVSQNSSHHGVAQRYDDPADGPSWEHDALGGRGG